VAQPAVRFLDDDEVVLRRTGVRFPVELRPAGFDAAELSTWPDADGRLEWVEGRLLYMPPCADIQQEVAVDVVVLLGNWSNATPGFVVGGNEAGMRLGNDIRAADAAVWRRDRVGPLTGKLRNAPPLLAVEIAGQDEEERVLREKAKWYIAHGVTLVWLVIPESHRVVVLESGSEATYGRSEQLPEHAELPGLSPDVASFFRQIDRA
jgi:Uma2 family endonuclease